MGVISFHLIQLLLPENSEKELCFDLDQFQALKDNALSIAVELSQTKNAAVKSMTDLEVGWNTPAGKSFFAELDRDWIPAVDKLIESMQVFADMMEDLKSIFQTVQDGADSIKF